MTFDPATEGHTKTCGCNACHVRDVREGSEAWREQQADPEPVAAEPECRCLYLTWDPVSMGAMPDPENGRHHPMCPLHTNSPVVDPPMTDDEVMAALNVPFQFWTCPTCPSPRVTWQGGFATCQECGKTNRPPDFDPDLPEELMTAGAVAYEKAQRALSILGVVTHSTLRYARDVLLEGVRALLQELPICVQCGKDAEPERKHYAQPTCYACLPPPPPLPWALIWMKHDPASPPQPSCSHCLAVIEDDRLHLPGECKQAAPGALAERVIAAAWDQARVPPMAREEIPDYLERVMRGNLTDAERVRAGLPPADDEPALPVHRWECTDCGSTHALPTRSRTETVLLPPGCPNCGGTASAYHLGPVTEGETAP